MSGYETDDGDAIASCSAPWTLDLGSLVEFPVSSGNIVFFHILVSFRPQRQKNDANL